MAKAVLIGAIPPLMVKTPSNPGGLPIEVFDIKAFSETDLNEELLAFVK